MSVTVKIPLEKLETGMIVVRFDKGGLTFPYYGKPFPDKKICQYLKKNGVRYVFVRQETSVNNTSLYVNEISKHADAIMNTSVTQKAEELPPTNLPRINDIIKVVEIHNRAKQITTKLLTDVRLGRVIDSSIAKDVVAEFVDNCIQSPEAFVNITRLKDFDQYTFTHSVNVSVLSIAIGRRLGVSMAEMNSLGFAGLLHDVGKMKIPESILNKPARLTDTEFEVMKTHPMEGYKYIKSNKGASDEILFAIRHHHEKSDGSGYPDGLLDSDIPRFAKVIAISDVYDAITSERVYHAGMIPSEALKLIFSWSGKHFNDSLVKFFIGIMGIYPVGTLVLLDTNELAIIIKPNKDDPMRPSVLIISDEHLEPATPQLFDLSTFNLVTKKPYKSVVSALDPKDFSIDTNSIIEQYIRT